MNDVLCVADCNTEALARLFLRFGLRMHLLAADTPIPGSYFGESEAGLLGAGLYVRPDTPLHSAFHEACHYICMDESRRAQLDCDAGGDYDEENAVCYLQILLADGVPELGRARMLADMDAWGYTFRLGSARAWFEQDADDAREWLLREGLIDVHLRPAWLVRGARERSGPASRRLTGDAAFGAGSADVPRHRGPAAPCGSGSATGRVSGHRDECA